MTLDEADIWVVGETLRLASRNWADREQTMAEFMIHKCEKNGVEAVRCRRMLEMFGLLDARADRRIDRYSVAR